MAARVRTAATMLALLGILVAAAYYGWLGITQGWGDDTSEATADDQPTQSCTTPPPTVVRTRDVRVSVYNAGAPSNQATQTMAALTEQGFREGELTDTPDGIEVRGIVLWPGNAEDAAVQLVQQQFRKARIADRRARTIKTLGPGINVLVGRDFDRLARNAPRRIEVPRPEVCEPVS